MLRLATSERASVSSRRLTRTAATGYDNTASHEDLPLVVSDYVAALPLPMLAAWAQRDDDESWIPYGVVSGIIFKAVARVMRLARLSW